MKSLPIVLLSLSLGACSNTVAGLHYTPGNPVRAAAASITTVTAIDQRKEAPARLATIMGLRQSA